MTKIVGGTVVKPDGQALGSVPIEIELFLAEAFVVTGSYSLAPKITVQTAVNGTWQTPLVENDAITPTGTIYRVTEKTPSQFGSSKSYYIQVLTGLGGGINQVAGLLVPAPVPVGGTYSPISSGPDGDAGYIEVANIAARDALTPKPSKLVMTTDSGVIWYHDGTIYRPLGFGNFVSTANRDTFYPTPLPGYSYYLKNNLINEGLYFRNSANQYRPPWNLPWGRVAYVETLTSTSGLGGTLTGLTGLAVSWDSVLNRKYRVIGKALISSTVASELWWLYIADGGGNGKSITEMHILIGSVGQTGIAIEANLVGTGANMTRQLAVQRVIGSGTGIAGGGGSPSREAFIEVEDVGPSGVPA